jgi:hypothetical protein
VGGTYGDNQTISHAALIWLAQEAKDLGLAVDLQKLETNMTASRFEIIHSQIYDTPWWAVAGMRVREAKHDPSCMAMSDCRVESPKRVLTYPQDTVWNRRRGGLGLALGGLAMFLFWSAYEQAYQGFMPDMSLTRWQLLAFADPYCAAPIATKAHIKMAVFWDFFLIAAYSYVFGRLMGRSFASLAGLSYLGQPRRRWLNILGMGLTLTVLSDVLEGLLTWLILSWSQDSWYWLICANRLFLSMFSAMKYAGIGMCLLLMGWACVHWLGKRISKQ